MILQIHAFQYDAVRLRWKAESLVALRTKIYLRFPVLNKHRIGTTFYLNGETSPQNRETTRPEEEWRRGDETVVKTHAIKHSIKLRSAETLEEKSFIFYLKQYL